MFDLIIQLFVLGKQTNKQLSKPHKETTITQKISFGPVQGLHQESWGAEYET